MSYFHDSKARMSLVYCRARIMKRELVPLQIWPCTSFLFSPSKFNLPLKERLSVCVCVCECVCVKHLERCCHPFENKSTEHYKPVQAEFCPVIYGKHGVYGLNRWCQDEQQQYIKKRMIHFPNHGKGPKDKQINGSLYDIWPRALTGPGVFGMNVNVKSEVFFICSESGQSWYLYIYKYICRYTILSWLKLISACIWGSSRSSVLNIYIFLILAEQIKQEKRCWWLRQQRDPSN